MPGDQLECTSMGCRHKTLFSQGSVGRMAWIDLGGHTYGGMFKGADTGFIRFSVATPVDREMGHMIPGIALKLLRDGQDSANIVAMPSLDG